LEEVII